MKIARFEFSLFGINTYVVYDEKSKECAIIDPGMLGIEEENAMKNFIMRERLNVTHLINTHLHIDHAVGNKFVADNYNVGLEAHKNDEVLGERISQQADMFGIKEKVNVIPITSYLEEGDKIFLGKEYLEVIHVPGHSQGSIALYSPNDGFLISGDALFAGSIGRSDLPGGNGAQLVRNIKEKLLTLPMETVVYPGHGDPTSINRERLYNPFLQ